MSMDRLRVCLIAATAALTISACGSQSLREDVEAQVERRFGPSAKADCSGGDDDRTWLCDVLIEETQRAHEGCRVFLDDMDQVTRITPC